MRHCATGERKFPYAAKTRQGAIATSATRQRESLSRAKEILACCRDDASLFGKRATCSQRERERERVRSVYSMRATASSSSARVTLPQYALVDPVRGFAIGIPRIHGMPDAPVEALTSVSKILLSFLRRLVTLALSSHVSQPPAEMSYHLLYAVMMMLLLLLFVFVGRTGRVFPR